MTEDDFKTMRIALENLTDSASHYIEDPVWFISLAMDLRQAASVLGNDKLYKKMDDWLSDDEEEE
jgi:hypothetical protein